MKPKNMVLFIDVWQTDCITDLFTESCFVMHQIGTFTDVLIMGNSLCSPENVSAFCTVLVLIKATQIAVSLRLRCGS